MQFPVRVSVPASREHGLDAPGLDPEAVVAGLADRTGAAVFLPAAAESYALPSARIDPVAITAMTWFRFGSARRALEVTRRRELRSDDRGGCLNPAPCCLG